MTASFRSCVAGDAALLLLANAQRQLAHVGEHLRRPGRADPLPVRVARLRALPP